jgi:hypothetical protein
MKRRIYLIAALALINIVIMKYNELKEEQKGNNWTMAEHRDLTTDSISSTTNK